MFRFADPFYFFLLIPAGVAAWYMYRKRIRSGILFAPTGRLSAHGTTWRTVAALVLPILFLAGLVLMVTALARPQTVFSSTRRTADMIAIEMVVDVSGSMDALDLSDIVARKIVRERTRLDAVKETFAKFVEKRPDDLIGLVTFGGFATTRVPLTIDHPALLHILRGVEIPKQVFENGQVINQEELLTAIGDALATACARLEHTEPKSKIVVLLSDGESNTGIIKPQEAMEAAKELGIKVYTIGVGSTGNAPFRGRDIFGRASIQFAQVSLDEVLLRKIAQTTGGQYFNVKDAKGLERAMDDINALEKTSVEKEEYNQYNELFSWFLGTALSFIVMGTGLNMMMTRRIV